MPKAKKSGVAKIADYRKTVETAAQDKCVCLSVEFATYGTQRKLDLTKVEMEADKSRVSASKSIMESENMDKIKSIWGRAHNWLGLKCLPGPLRKGVYLLPTELVVEVDQKLKQFEQDAQPYIKALVKELPTLKEQDRRDFRNQYNESDYPTAEALASSFYIYAQYIDFKVSDKLREISESLYAREVAKSKKGWEESVDQAREFLRETGLYFIQQMAKQLNGETKDGKRRPIYDVTINNLMQFAKDFPARNIADDDKMLYLVAKAKGLLDGVDAYDLREDEKLRTKVATELDKINADVAGLMKRPLRAIELA